jgi:hypothetical protein
LTTLACSLLHGSSLDKRDQKHKIITEFDDEEDGKQLGFKTIKGRLNESAENENENSHNYHKSEENDESGFERNTSGMTGTK